MKRRLPEPDDAYTRMRRNRVLIRKVPCPRCGAGTGRPCFTPSGSTVAVPHQARRHAAAVAGVYVP